MRSVTWGRPEDVDDVGKLWENIWATQKSGSTTCNASPGLRARGRKKTCAVAANHFSNCQVRHLRPSRTKGRGRQFGEHCRRSPANACDTMCDTMCDPVPHRAGQPCLRRCAKHRVLVGKHDVENTMRIGSEHDTDPIGTRYGSGRNTMRIRSEHPVLWSHFRSTNCATSCFGTFPWRAQVTR